MFMIESISAMCLRGALHLTVLEPYFFPALSIPHLLRLDLGVIHSYVPDVCLVDVQLHDRYRYSIQLPG